MIHLNGTGKGGVLVRRDEAYPSPGARFHIHVQADHARGDDTLLDGLHRPSRHRRRRLGGSLDGLGYRLGGSATFRDHTIFDWLLWQWF